MDVNSIVLVVLFSLICFAGTLGNALVLYIFNFHHESKDPPRTRRQRARVMDLLISYLAVIDFIASIFSPFLYIYLHVTGYQHWAFGDFGCTFIFGVANLTTTLSFGMIVFITAERSIAIYRPFKTLTSSRRRIHVLFLLLLLVSIGIDLPYLVNLKVRELNGISSNTTRVQYALQSHLSRRSFQEKELSTKIYICMTVRSEEYMTTRTVTFILRASSYIIIISIANWYVYKAISKHSLSVNRNKVKRRNERTFKLMVMIGVVFTILVLPKDLFVIVYNLSSDELGINHLTAAKINEWLKVPQSMNSVCNVFIYARLHYHFRRKVKNRIEWIKKSFERNNNDSPLIYPVKEDSEFGIWV